MDEILRILNRSGVKVVAYVNTWQYVLVSVMFPSVMSGTYAIYRRILSTIEFRLNRQRLLLSSHKKYLCEVKVKLEIKHRK